MYPPGPPQPTMGSDDGAALTEVIIVIYLLVDVSPGPPQPTMGSDDGAALTCGWLLIVRIPLLFRNSSFSLIKDVSAATVSSFQGRDVTYKQK